MGRLSRHGFQGAATFNAGSVKNGLNVAGRWVFGAGEVTRAFHANLVLVVNQLLVLVAGIEVFFVVFSIRATVTIFAMSDDAVLIFKARRFG